MHSAPRLPKKWKKIITCEVADIVVLSVLESLYSQLSKITKSHIHKSPIFKVIEKNFLSKNAQNC